MKTSLIVPAFNEEKYIGKLLDSVAAQSELPDEIIICNNNSTDNTVKIIHKYSSKLPIKIVTELQKGIRSATEKAWKSSTGDLILKTDADCILPDNWIKNIKLKFNSDACLSACGGGFRASDGHKIIQILTPLFTEINHKILYLNKKYVVLYGGNMAIKREVLQKIHGYNSTDKYLQDDILISQKLFRNKFKYCYFPDCWIFTSTRRFCNLKQVGHNLLSIFSPKFYLEKSS